LCEVHAFVLGQCAVAGVDHPELAATGQVGAHDRRNVLRRVTLGLERSDGDRILLGPDAGDLHRHLRPRRPAGRRGGQTDQQDQGVNQARSCAGLWHRGRIIGTEATCLWAVHRASVGYILRVNDRGTVPSRFARKRIAADDCPFRRVVVTGQSARLRQLRGRGLLSGRQQFDLEFGVHLVRSALGHCEHDVGPDARLDQCAVGIADHAGRCRLRARGARHLPGEARDLGLAPLLGLALLALDLLRAGLGLHLLLRLDFLRLAWFDRATFHRRWALLLRRMRLGLLLLDDVRLGLRRFRLRRSRGWRRRRRRLDRRQRLPQLGNRRGLAGGAPLHRKPHAEDQQRVHCHRCHE